MSHRDASPSFADMAEYGAYVIAWEFRQLVVYVSSGRLELWQTDKPKGWRETEYSALWGYGCWWYMHSREYEEVHAALRNMIGKPWTVVDRRLLAQADALYELLSSMKAGSIYARMYRTQGQPAKHYIGIDCGHGKAECTVVVLPDQQRPSGACTAGSGGPLPSNGGMVSKSRR